MRIMSSLESTEKIVTHSRRLDFAHLTKKISNQGEHFSTRKVNLASGKKIERAILFQI